jgi:murein DD-endopeptidase MepM/ murein hydrolase activator NlpD
LILAAVNLDPSSGKPAAAAAAVPALNLKYADLSAPVKFDLPEHSVLFTFEEDDTLAGVLSDGGLGRSAGAYLTGEIARHIDVRRLRPGHQVRFHYDAEHQVDAVQMKVAGWGELSALRNDAGKFDVTAREAKIQQSEINVAATINSSLYEAVREAGEGPQLVQQLIDVFQWDIDFFELQRGDSFSVVVDKRYADGDFIGYGPVTAARFTHDGTTYEAFRSATSTSSGYYNAQGAPLRKQFLRAPLKFTRVTSGFTKKRFHPVLHLFRPHNGVDYGAPVGTPVMTTADGVVVENSFRGGEGNYVRIRHSSATETWYLHLSRFAKGLRKGTKVTQGDVIGYVGQSGLATGPHLDYRVRESGSWIDPLKLKSITPDPLRGEALRAFRNNVARTQSMLANTGSQVASSGTKRRALF